MILFNSGENVEKVYVRITFSALRKSRAEQVQSFGQEDFTKHVNVDKDGAADLIDSPIHNDS